MSDQGTFRIYSNREMQEAVKDDNYLFYVGMVQPARPGFTEFITYVEYEHYTPGTDRAEFYNLWMFRWSGMFWAMIGVPLVDESLIQKSADLCGLRIADGIPTILGGENSERFPVSRFNVYTMENHPDHPVYRNDPTVNAVLRKAEEAAVEAMHKQHQG